MIVYVENEQEPKYGGYKGQFFFEQSNYPGLSEV